MESDLIRRLILGFMELQVLACALKSPIWGTGMYEYLRERDVKVSMGTLNPMLKHMEKSGLLTASSKRCGKSTRIYYEITDKGLLELRAGLAQARTTLDEIDTMMGEIDG